MKKQKVVFFTKENKGGTVRYLSYLVPDLGKKFQTRIFFYKKNTKGFRIPTSSFISKEYPSDEGFQLRKVVATIHNLYKTWRVIKELDDESVCIVLDIYSYLLVSSTIFLLHKKNNIVYFVENNYFMIKKKRGLFFRYAVAILYRFFLQRINFFIFTSASLEKDYRHEFKLRRRNTTVLPLGVNSNNAPSFRGNMTQNEKQLLRKSSYILLSTMNYTPQKDFETLFAAFQLIIKRYPSIKLIIIGDGNLQKELTQKIHSINLQESIFLLGWKKNVREFLNRADIFVFSSFFEGFGLSLVEAMAAGLPIVSSETDYGPSELLQNQRYGLLYPVGDAEKLADCVIKLIKNKSLRQKYIKRGKKRAGDFKSSVVNKLYIDFFMSIYEKKENPNYR